MEDVLGSRPGCFLHVSRPLLHPYAAEASGGLQPAFNKRKTRGWLLNHSRITNSISEAEATALECVVKPKLQKYGENHYT